METRKNGNWNVCHIDKVKGTSQWKNFNMFEKVDIFLLKLQYLFLILLTMKNVLDFLISIMTLYMYTSPCSYLKGISFIHSYYTCTCVETKWIYIHTWRALFELQKYNRSKHVTKSQKGHQTTTTKVGCNLLT